MADDLLFIDDEPESGAEVGKPENEEAWIIMIVDDEPGVHEITKLVMRDFQFDGRGLKFVHCYSGSEALTVLKQRDDIALILLDVVMETDHAGLDLAKQVREELNNYQVRIVLRTGQPGQAPEEQVIRAYDINDYKEKTELTHGKLFTVFYSSLRAYRDIIRLEKAKAGLRRAIGAISEVYNSRNLYYFASAVLEQVNHLLNLDGDGLCAGRVSAYAASSSEGPLRVLAATSGYDGLLVGGDLTSLPGEVQHIITRTLTQKCSQFGSNQVTCYYHSKTGTETVVYMSFATEIKEDARELLEIFTANVAITYENLLLHEDLEETQFATILLLGEAVEQRSKETGQHVKRVGELSALLARHKGLAERDIEFIRCAAPLHDVGKIGIPDAVLNKPARLDTEEMAQMQCHSNLGFEILNRSDKPALKYAATIAHQHHERWDGNGYPLGLKGQNIHLAGRIVAIADVLDALVSPRIYKQPWGFDEALAYIRAGSGSQFDPELVEILLAHIPEIEEIYRLYPAQ